MFSRLFSRGDRSVSNQRPAYIEGLEGRVLMTAAPKIISIVADNRGEVVLTSSRTLVGVSKSSVKLFSAGADGLVGTVDDVRQPFQAIFTTSNNRITIKGNLPANTGYRVRVQSAMVTSVDGRKLDGEFTGGTTSGDGRPGGNFSFAVKNDKTASPVVRISTTEGVMSVRMDKTNSASSVNAYIAYANSGQFDGSFFTRVMNGFIDQGGSLRVSGSNHVISGSTPLPEVSSPYVAGTTLEPLRGTLSLARGFETKINGYISFADDVFFNVQDNSSILDGQNGGFVSIGTITNSAGLAVMDAINGKQTFDLTGQISNTVQTTSRTDLATVPVENASAATNLNPSADLIIMRRIAVLDKIVPIA